jgi:glc operon protein GlcG
VVWLAVAGTSLAQDRPPRIEIKDNADMFSKQAIETARSNLEMQIGGRRLFEIPLVIETIEQLGRQSIEEATRQHAEKSGSEGIYVLIARRDHKIDVLVSKDFASAVPEPFRKKIQQAFIQGLKSGDFDAGLNMGATAIRSAPMEAKQQANAGDWTGRQTAEAAPAGPSSLVLRNQVRLTLAGAERILAGAQKKAAEMKLKMNIAVVDDGGHMIAFARMDGARPASGYTATTKAVTAATFRAPSGPVPPGTTAPDPLLNLSLQNAALASGGKITTLLGGVPVLVDDQVIGGVGVGGGTGEQDATVARAGVDAFLAALKPPAEAPLPEAEGKP